MLLFGALNNSNCNDAKRTRKAVFYKAANKSLIIEEREREKEREREGKSVEFSRKIRFQNACAFILKEMTQMKRVSYSI